MIRATVVDMQPITPAIGGGRLRLLGLYHALGEDFRTTYIGTYDWPGEPARELALSPTLTEITVPLSAAHFRADAQWRRFADGRTIIDSAFALLGRLSPDFVDRARVAVEQADIVVFAHPWVYPLLSESIEAERQMIVYDSQNAEALIKAQLLGESPFAAELAKSVAMAECFLARDSDFVLGCTEEDAAFFRSSYRVPADRIGIVPNGVFSQRIVPATVTQRQEARSRLGLDGAVAIFLGSDYEPNREAGRFIGEELAPAHPSITFAICGGVGQSLSMDGHMPDNVRISGLLDDEQKLAWLHAADVAVNPMFSGSGTNIKMFDFMAAGLPVISTETGARGIATQTREGVFVCTPDAVGRQVAELCKTEARRIEAGHRNREWVEREFAWEHLSPMLGDRLRERLRARARRSPSVRNTSAAAASDPEPVRVETSPIRLGVFSTFGIECGIAEYASYLVQALRDVGASVWVFGNHIDARDQTPEALSSPIDGVTVEPIWHYDQRTWTRSRVDQARLLRVLDDQRISHLNVQYHRAFLPEPVLFEVLEATKRAAVALSVTLHNSADVTPDFVTELVRQDVLIIVHNADDVRRLHAAGVRRVYHLPQGVRRFPVGAPPARAVDADPVLSTFGFLRPHKGLLELLGAIDILRHLYPAIRLHAQTALYPTADSSDYLARVQARIEELSLQRHVTLDTRFVPIDDAVGRLADTDVVVLPYAISDEGSSAAAAAALAARRPIVATRARIFDDVRSSVYTAESNEPEVLAVAIATVCSNASLRRHLQQLSTAAATERDWHAVARRFLELVAPKPEVSPASVVDPAKASAASRLSERERALVRAALDVSRIGLNTAVPDVFGRHYDAACDIVAQVESIYGDAAQSDYFTSSKLRYAHYFSIARSLKPGARLLEIGSAPGHVSVGLALMGFAMTCVNLNELYRSTYASAEWFDRLNVIEHDFEKAPLPFADGSFDVAYFTEVLEHVAVKAPVAVLRDIRRVCKPGGKLVLSTPNVCNISNVFALLNGANIFWRPEIFYGTLDRHNREFTVAEVEKVVTDAGFVIRHQYGFNCHSNWRSGGHEQAYRTLAEFGDDNPLLRNTIMVVAEA